MFCLYEVLGFRLLDFSVCHLFCLCDLIGIGINVYVTNKISM